MAKIIQFDLSRKVRSKYYSPEALRGRLLQFKSLTASVESASVAVSDAAHLEALAGHNLTDTKIS
jgi:hypothetical protein